MSKSARNPSAPVSQSQAPPSSAEHGAGDPEASQAGGGGNDHVAIAKKGVTSITNARFGKTFGVSNHLIFVIIGVINIGASSYYTSGEFDLAGFIRCIFVALSIGMMLASFSASKINAFGILSFLMLIWVMEGLYAFAVMIRAIVLSSIRVPCNPDDLENQDVSCKLGMKAPWMAMDVFYFFPYSILKVFLMVFYARMFLVLKKEREDKTSSNNN